MRILTMLTGILFVGVGVYLVANAGITFLSVAFIIGLMFIVAGIAEVLSYSSYRGDNEERTWILTDGLTTFVLGFLIIANKISSDGIVTGILGIWVLVTGIRNFVHGWESIETRKDKFYDHLIVGLLNLFCGLYVFFNADIFDIAFISLIGLCVIVQGLNIFHIGATIRIVKPHFIKTKEEKLKEAGLKVEEAHNRAREAIKAAKEAKLEFLTVQETPEEKLDLVLAPKPGTEKAETTEQETLSEEVPKDSEAVPEKKAAKKKAEPEKKTAKKKAVPEKKAAKKKAEPEKKAVKKEAESEKKAAKKKAEPEKKTAKKEAVPEKKAAKKGTPKKRKPKAKEEKTE